MAVGVQYPALLAALAGALLLGACRIATPAGNENEARPANVAEAPPAPALLPAPERPLDREALLIAAIRARSAAATGTDDRAAQAALDGKRFEFRIPLGCRFAPARPTAAPARARPAAAPSALTATYDAGERRVELSARPDLSLDQPIVAQIAGDAFEAAEGFWIPRPWLLVPSCAGSEAAAPAATPQSVGLAQFFTAREPRTERREGRPYVARQEIEAPAEAPSPTANASGTAPPAGPTPGSWNLVLTGRLRELGDRVIHCRAPTPGAMPVCIISIELEQVSIEQAGTGTVLEHWERG